jgi:hypothetical protein
MVGPEELKLNGDDCLASLEVSAEAAGVDSACRVVFSPDGLVFVYFFSGLECVGHSFAYVAHLRFLRDVWIRTQSAAVANWRATDLATHPSA